MKPGDITKSGKYILKEEIDDLEKFWFCINHYKSIFARHKMYPSAFFYSWSIKLIKKWINRGWFWIANPTNNK